MSVRWSNASRLVDLARLSRRRIDRLKNRPRHLIQPMFLLTEPAPFIARLLCFGKWTGHVPCSFIDSP